MERITMSKKISTKDAIEFLKYLAEADRIKYVSTHIRGKNGEEYQVAYLDDYYAVEHSTGIYNKISEEDLKDLKKMEFIGFRVRSVIDIGSDFVEDSSDTTYTFVDDWHSTINLTLKRIKIAWRAFQKINRG